MKFHILKKELYLFLSLSMIISSFTIPVSAQETAHNNILNPSQQNQTLTNRKNLSQTSAPPSAVTNIANYSKQLTGRSAEFYNILENEINGKMKQANGAFIEIPTNYSFTFTNETDKTTKFSAYFQEISQDFTKAFDAFTRDHPEIFWLGYPSYNLGYSYSKDTATTKNFKCTLQWDSDYSTLEQINSDSAAMNAKINEILAAAPTTNDYDKVKYFHDWLTKNNRYNPARRDNLKSYDTLSTHKPWSAVGAFLSNKDATTSPVCEGYSKAFKILCDKANIPCVLISGTGASTAGVGANAHMWNYVQLNGNWYAVDVTWDDPIINGTEDGDGTYTYFVKSAASFTDHTPNNGAVSVNGASFTYPTLSANDFTP